LDLENPQNKSDVQRSDQRHGARRVDITSRYESLSKNNIIGDFKFVLSEKFLSNDSDLRWHEK
jgi:hypothetical protein